MYERTESGGVRGVERNTYCKKTIILTQATLHVAELVYQ